MKRFDSLIRGSSEDLSKAPSRSSPKLLGKLLKKTRKHMEKDKDASFKVLEGTSYNVTDLYSVPKKGKETAEPRRSVGIINPNYDDLADQPVAVPRVMTNTQYGADQRLSRPTSYTSIGGGESAYAEVYPDGLSDADYRNVGLYPRGRHGNSKSPETWTVEEVKLWMHPIVHEDSRSSWEDAVECGGLTGQRLLRLKFADLRALENDYYEVFRDIGSVFEALDLLRSSVNQFEPDPEPLYDNIHFDDGEGKNEGQDDLMTWHHGAISRPEAERRLHDQGGEPGLFLVRTRHAGTGALTLVTDDGIEHYLLYELDGFYTINGRRVNMSRSLVELVQQLRGDLNNPLPIQLRRAAAKPSRDEVPHLPMRKSDSVSSQIEC